MKFRVGRLLNSIYSKCKTSCSLSSCFSFNNKSNELPTSSVTNNTTRNSTKKITLRKYLTLIFYTFFYNETADTLTCVEIILQPFMCCFNNFIRIFGRVFVLLVWTLSINMLFVFYAFIVPELIKTNFLNFIVHFIFGNWLAANTFFHYAMGWLTDPGTPPNTNIENIVTICRRCIAPKPLRAHHCSVCNKCVLKMDHHCPWFNNCIGFYNHRYFFLFCTFMSIDCLYLITYGFHYYQLYAYPSRDLTIINLITENVVPHATEGMPASHIYHKLNTMEFFAAFAAMFALIGLASFNFYIISRGATNIEIKSLNWPCLQSNDDEKHLYDLGFVKNWKVFLGFDDLRSFFFKVILPSAHKPLGDGVSWYEYLDLRKSSYLKTFKHEIFPV